MIIRSPYEPSFVTPTRRHPDPPTAVIPRPGYLYRTTVIVLLFAAIRAVLGWWGAATGGTGVAGFMPVAALTFVVGALVAPRSWILQIGVGITLLPMVSFAPYDRPHLPHRPRLLIELVIGAFTTTSLFYVLVQRVKWSCFDLLTVHRAELELIRTKRAHRPELTPA